MKTLVNIILFLTVMVNSASAQVILPLGLGQKNSLNITCSDGDKLWLISDDGQKFAINKWDGNFWIQYKDIPDNLLSALAATHQLIDAKAIYYHKGELCVAFANSQSGKLLLIKSAGRTWETINTDKISVESDLTFITAADTLLLCGKITVDNLPKSILKINDTNCEVYAGTWANQNISSKFKDFEYSGNKIWSIGIFSSATDPTAYFAVLENKLWKPVVDPPFTNGFLAFGKYDNRLITAGKDFDGKKSFSFQSKTDPLKWIEESNGLANWEIISISDLRQVGKNLWAAGEFRNSVTQQTATLAFWDGTKWSIPQFDYLGNDVKLNGANEVLISGSFYDHQGLVLNKTGKLNFGTALIAGKIFNDLNGNCTQDIGEDIIRGAVIKLMPEDIYTITDHNGRYYFPVDTKISVHSVWVEIPLYHSATCESFKAVKHTNELTKPNIDFGLISLSGHTDVAVSIQDFTGWRARQGFDENYNICATNKGTKKLENCKLEFKSDPRISNWIFSETPTTSQNHISEWNIKTLMGGESYCINCKANISMQIPLQEKLLFEAKVLTDNDENSGDNKSVLQQNVVAAIDPNDKTTKQAYIIAPTATAIDYKIRFQNNGNDTAYNIRVTDEIDRNLIITKEGVLYSSSFKDIILGYTWWLDTDGKYRHKFAFLFEDIKLPDSQTNETGSQGYINLSLNIRPNIPLGTTISNRAFIYFDYQEAIITNTAKNLVSLEDAVNPLFVKNKLTIYPNPATDNVYISNPLKTGVSIHLVNSLGQTILTKTANAESELTIETSNMPKGLYLIKAQGYAPYKLLVH